MRLLSQFGEVEYYKNLKYEELSQPRSATIIYKDEEAANECLRRSPIRFRMGRATGPPKAEESEAAQDHSPASEADNEASIPRGPIGTPFGLGMQTRSMSTSHHQLPKPPRSSQRLYMPFESPPEPQLAPGSRIFEIVVNRSSRNYRDRVNIAHYHGPFAIDTKMAGQGDLAKKVPTPGLSCVDWKAVEKPWHVIQTEKERDKNGLKARRRLGLLWEENRNKVPEQQDKSGSEDGIKAAGEHDRNSSAQTEFGII
jgi:hypothetical protein